MKKLNIGTGNDYKYGWINIDNDKKYNPDVLHDLNKYPYPFKSKYFDYVLASHIIEHLDDPVRFITEIKRILKTYGILEIIVPHYTNPMAYTPLHKWYFSYKAIDQITQDMKIIKKEIIFTPKYKFMEKVDPIFYENTPLRIFPAKEIRVIIKK